MTDLEVYLDKFSESGRRVLEGALAETRRRDQHFIAPEHILFALVTEEAELFAAAMRDVSLDAARVRLAIEKRLENGRRHIGKGFRIAPETIEIFKRSMDKARSENRRVIEAGDLLYTLTTNKLDLLNDILHNPAGKFWESAASRTDVAVNRNHFTPQLQTKPSDFLTRFSLKDSINNNTSASGSLLKNHMGGIGGMISGGNSEQTTHHKHESLFCPIKPTDAAGFYEAEFTASLKKEMEEEIRQSDLSVTTSAALDSSSFRIEYRNEFMHGQLEISGEMKNRCYELRATVVEKSTQKTK